jgi:succinyl-diaminopimelate desuccinylase
MAIDAVKLTQDLVRCPSVTPHEVGVLSVLQNALLPLGFVCRRMPFSDASTPDIDNLVATIGNGARHFAFAGHLDVVPAGDEAAWDYPPFAAEIHDGILYGRGSADMKSGVAAFAAACDLFLQRRGHDFGGQISLIITGDEEGPAINGTTKMMQQLQAENALPDVCLVGEPTCPDILGEAMKIGRRGSLTAYMTVQGVQGHVAYPDKADNPIHRLVKALTELTAEPLDDGNAYFPPSTLAVTTVDVGNPATNVIPASVSATLNVRFNTEHTAESLKTWLTRVVTDHAPTAHIRFECSAEPFVTPPGALSELVAEAVLAVTGRQPELSTSGGTSDARFIKSYCPVVEFGLVGKTIHKVNEHTPVQDISDLAQIYLRILERYFDNDG